MKWVIAILTCAVLTGCADSVSFASAADVPLVGFWHGLWHGIIAPISWFISLFSDKVAIYAIYNNGGWYDFGFILGIGALSSSGSSSAKRGGSK